MLRSIIAILGTGVLLGGCVSDGVGPREGIGALTGAVGGAFLGDKLGKGRVLATAAGTLAGMAIGADIGQSLDRANENYSSRAPVGHSQQTPVPGFAPSPHVDGARSTYPTAFGDTTATGPIRDASDCRALDDGGLRPTYACRNRVGQWFILQ